MSSPSGGDEREIYHPMMRFGNYPFAEGTGPQRFKIAGKY
jgi:hypothetical protein